MTMSRVVTVPKSRRTWRTMLLSGAAVPRLATARPETSCFVGDTAVALPNPPSDFDITTPGSVLTTGQTAEVLTRLPQGPTLYWEITAMCARRIAPGDIGLGRDDRDDLGAGINPAAGEVGHYVLTPYEIEFLGAGDDGNPVVQSAVAVPVLTASDATGRAVNPLIFSAEEHCGIPAADAVPSTVEELAEGRTYRGAVLSYVRADSAGGSDGQPVGVRFIYQAEGAELEPLHGGRVIWR
ncbi:MAG: hypothetical protein ACTH1D_09440 [Mycobacteriaceae bacterium]|uniref:hypothetical protein n=1 Tax=Corynebacterium sp. TaxID=1720 RepID=UPI003F9D6359